MRSSVLLQSLLSLSLSTWTSFCVLLLFPAVFHGVRAEREGRTGSSGAGLGWSAIQNIEDGYSHLVERYAPDFVGLSRGIIGRVVDDQQQLTNNKPAKSTISYGKTQYFSFSQNDLLGPKSAATSGLPSPFDRRDVLDASPEEHTEELKKRQGTGSLFISLNVCGQPTFSDSAPDQLSVYVSTSSGNQKPTASDNNVAMDVEGGYGDVTVTSSDGVYISVEAPAGSASGNYNFQLTASIDGYYAIYNDSNFPGSTSFLHFGDSDNQNAIFFTTNLTSQNTPSAVIDTWKSNPPPFTIFVQNQDNSSLFGLERSLCALQDLAQIQGSSDVETSIVSAGDGLLREQIYVSSLNGSSSYQAFLAIIGNSTSSGEGVVNGGGTVFPRVNFTTNPGENCAVIRNLEFCTDVAYAVPTNQTSFKNTTELGIRYDEMAADIYVSFNKSLQQIPCDTTSSAQYSLARTCTDCDHAYRRWLCAVTIPRCVDFSNNASYLMPRIVDNYNISEQFANLRPFNPYNKLIPVANQSRNPWIDQNIEPGQYKERLPCIDLCQELVQSCPSALQFGCPLPGYGQSLSYGYQPGKGMCNSLNPQDNGSAQLPRPGLWVVGLLLLLGFTMTVT